MLFEKLVLSLYVKNYQQLDNAKEHLLLSVRELLLSVTFVMDIAKKLSSQNSLFKRFFPMNLALQKIDDVLRYSIQRMGSHAADPDFARFQKIKEQILETILGALDEEIDSSPQKDQARDRFRIEALQAVKKALLNHLYVDNEPPVAELSDDMREAANA